MDCKVFWSIATLAHRISTLTKIGTEERWCAPMEPPNDMLDRKDRREPSRRHQRRVNVRDGYWPPAPWYLIPCIPFAVPDVEPGALLWRRLERGTIHEGLSFLSTDIEQFPVALDITLSSRQKLLRCGTTYHQGCEQSDWNIGDCNLAITIQDCTTGQLSNHIAINRLVFLNKQQILNTLILVYRAFDDIRAHII